MAIFSTGLAGASAPEPLAKPGIEISITGLRNAKGDVLTCITAVPKYFPDCSHDPHAVKGSVKTSAARDYILSVPADGTYAIALLHDENSNHKMDMFLMLPREGFGFSNNPAVVTGPPRFKTAAFAVEGDTKITIRMKYML